MDKLLQLPSLSSSIGSIDAYIHNVNQMHLLSAEEEYNLAVHFRNEGALESARQLVLAHLRYVVRVARGYMGYGLPLNDLIQEGNVGLMKAVKRFDPDMGVRLVSFAVHWIKAEIHEFIIRNWRIVKVATTKAQRKLFFNLRRMKNHLGQFKEEEAVKVAQELGVKVEEVFTMEQRLTSTAMDVSFNLSQSTEEEDYKSPANYLSDPQGDPATIVEQERSGAMSRERLYLALERLDGRSQEILQYRWFSEDKMTLHDLATKYQVSAERIRQLEKNAMKKLRQYMEE